MKDINLYPILGVAAFLFACVVLVYALCRKSIARHAADVERFIPIFGYLTYVGVFLRLHGGTEGKQRFETIMTNISSMIPQLDGTEADVYRKVVLLYELRLLIGFLDYVEEATHPDYNTKYSAYQLEKQLDGKSILSRLVNSLAPMSIEQPTNDELIRLGNAITSTLNLYFSVGSEKINKAER